MASLRADDDHRGRVKGASRVRVRRVERIDTIVVHRIGGTARLASLDDVVRFFTEDPEGIATVTLTGTWERRGRIAKAWREHGVPRWASDRAHVPYHAIVYGDRLGQFLDIGRRGAHAAGVNATSLAYAVLGDFRDEGDPGGAGPHHPTGRALARLERGLADAVRAVPSIERIVGHDEVRTVPKGCPGARLLRELPAMSARVLSRAPAPVGTE